MSEFDLIDPRKSGPPSVLVRTSSDLIGRSSQPILQVWLGEKSWDDRLTPKELPGWLELDSFSEGSPGPFVWQTDTKALNWNQRVLFVEETAPTIHRPDTHELTGLLRREDDPLPAGSDRAVKWTLKLPEKTRLYGLGQRSGPLERTGLTCVNWTTDSPIGHNRTTDPLYQAHPLLWGTNGEYWWAILLCHTGYSRFDLACRELGQLEILALGDSLCLQVHAAETPSELLTSLRQTLADPTPPPLWAFGFHQSRWGYKAAAEVEELIESFKSREIPLDVVHLDIDHMESYRSFSFDPERFPDPSGLFREWAKRGVRVVTIIDPGLKFDPSPEYGPLLEGLTNGHFITSASGAPVVGYCWPDEALFPDFFREKTRQWWADLANFYLDSGVAGLWIDMNEPAIFDRPFWTGQVNQHPMPLDTPWGEDHKRLDHARLRNVYGSAMAKATEAAWEKRDARPWVLTRAAFCGTSHHAWSWMGDNTSWWEHLALSFPQLSSMSLVNAPFSGVDIGGFFGHCDGELYSAWIEASIVYPFMRAHSALGTNLAHPWSFGEEVEKVSRQALELRYRLLPYIYGASMAYVEGGTPLLRPMFFDLPNDRRFDYLEDQVWFGPDMIACPFVTRGRDQRMVVLPEKGWYNFHTGERLKDDTVIITRDPGRIPLFCRPGSVIPLLERSVQSTDEAHNEDWVLRHFPAQRQTISKLYWDQGDGHDPHPFRATLVNDKGKLSVLDLKEHGHPRTVRIERATPDGFQLGQVQEFSEL